MNDGALERYETIKEGYIEKKFIFRFLDYFKENCKNSCQDPGKFSIGFIF